MTRTVIEIRWAWLSLLVIQIVLAALFVASVAIQAVYMQVRVLKNSALATMLAISAADKAALEAAVMAEKNGGAGGRFVSSHGADVSQILRERCSADVMGTFTPEAGSGWMMSLERRGMSLRNR